MDSHNLSFLKSFKARKSMYINPVNVDTVLSFLFGFRLGTGATGATVCQGWWKAQERRGWKRSSVGPVPQMREKGMTDLEIMDELIEIELDFESASKL